jgi:Zn-dependent alcohol dehydrogenase
VASESRPSSPRRYGAHAIIAIDLDDAKLEWARRKGATHTVNTLPALEVNPADLIMNEKRLVG